MPTPDDYEPPKKGRPPKLTQDLIDRFIAVITRKQFRSVACQRVGIPDSLYVQLRHRLLHAETEAEIVACETVYDIGKTEDPKYLCWWLERKYPERWGRYRGELKQLEKEVAELRKLIEDRHETEPV
jgi:hypothetical protein